MTLSILFHFIFRYPVPFCTVPFCTVLKSAYGETAPLRLKESKGIKKGTLFATFHFEESFINRLFGDESDSVTKTPRFKAAEVEVI